MGAILPALWKKIGETCQQCEDVFSSQQFLNQFFSDSTLYSWQEGLPQMRDKDQRIDATLVYLSEKENALGQNALVLFLQALSTHYGSQDKRYQPLQQHIRGLQAGLPPITRKRTHDALAEPLQQRLQLSTQELSSISQSAHSVALIKARRFHQGRPIYKETGTGWLIAPGLLLTCLHVVTALDNVDDTPPDAIDIQHQLQDMLVFFHQTEHRGGIDYRIKQLEFKSTQEQDFAILRLDNRKHNLYEQFHYLLIEPDAPLNTQTQLFIIQHPWGEPQQVAIDGSYVAETELPGRICYTTDTQPGTSGAPVLRRQSGCVVAMHNGKIVEEAVHSEGTHIEDILGILEKQSPELHQEIMHYQGKLNRAFIQPPAPKEPVAMISATQRQLQTALSPVALSFQEGEGPQQHPPEPEKRFQHYTYLTACTSTAPILCLAFDPTGKEVLYGAQTNGIYRIEATTLRPLSILKTSTKAVPSLAFSPDGKYIAGGGDDGTVILWQRVQSELICYKTLQAHSDWVTGVAFSANGRYVVSGSDDGSLRILDIENRNSQILQKPPGIRTLACHPQQELGASCSLDQKPVIWQITPNDDADPPELAGPVHCLRFSPNGLYLVGGNAEGKLVVYDTRTWNSTFLPVKHTKTIRCLAFHPHSALLASGGDDQTIQLWNILTRQHVQTLPGHSGRITGLAFSPDGHFLASAGRDAKLIVWHAL